MVLLTWALAMWWESDRRVEDDEWVDELRRLGVGYVQGYGIGHPAPVRLATGLTAWRQ